MRKQNVRRLVHRRQLPALVAVIAIALLVVPMVAFAAPAPKTKVCHNTGNGSFHLINVSGNALDKHIAHGDFVPGDHVPDMAFYVFGEDCSPELDVVEVVSAPLYYSSTGWAGWSCPTGTQVFDAWVVGITAAQSALWKPGASLAGSVYPNTPFGYTYTPPEEGFIAQADGTGGTAYIHLLCG